MLTYVLRKNHFILLTLKCYINEMFVLLTALIANIYDNEHRLKVLNYSIQSIKTTKFCQIKSIGRYYKVHEQCYRVQAQVKNNFN